MPSRSVCLGQLAAEHGRERVAVRGDDQRHGVDQRAVEVEDDRRVAHPASGSSGAERRQRVVGEEVEAQRRERDVALGDGGDVRARLALEAQRRVAVEPVVAAAALGLARRPQLRAGSGGAEPRDAHAGDGARPAR